MKPKRMAKANPRYVDKANTLPKTSAEKQLLNEPETGKSDIKTSAEKRFLNEPEAGKSDIKATAKKRLLNAPEAVKSDIKTTAKKPLLNAPETGKSDVKTPAGKLLLNAPEAGKSDIKTTAKKRLMNAPEAGKPDIKTPAKKRLLNAPEAGKSDIKTPAGKPLLNAPKAGKPDLKTPAGKPLLNTPVEKRLLKAPAGRIITKREFRSNEMKMKNIQLKFEIDAEEMAALKTVDVPDLKRYLLKQIKVKGKDEKLGDNVTIEQNQWKLIVTSKVSLKKTFLKYLTQKYLKKAKLTETVHVLSDVKKSLQIKYFRAEPIDLFSDEEEDSQ